MTDAIRYLMQSWPKIRRWPDAQRRAAVEAARAGYVDATASMPDGTVTGIDLAGPCFVTMRCEGGVIHVIDASGPP